MNAYKKIKKEQQQQIKLKLKAIRSCVNEKLNLNANLKKILFLNFEGWVKRALFQ